MDADSSTGFPTREELNAELLAVPEPPEQPETPHPPGYEESLIIALRHVKGRRGGDLVGVILVGSGARRAVTPHSNIDLIALVKGQTEVHQILRVGERLADIRYHDRILIQLIIEPCDETLDRDRRGWLNLVGLSYRIGRRGWRRRLWSWRTLNERLKEILDEHIVVVVMTDS